jgi:uncharacterized protein YuzE
MKITYDPKTDSLYIDLSSIAFRKKHEYMKTLDHDTILLDKSADGKILGFEIVNASTLVDKDLIKTAKNV